MKKSYEMNELLPVSPIEASRPDGCRKGLRRLLSLFWLFTETAGRADTSSYKGLL